MDSDSGSRTAAKLSATEILRLLRSGPSRPEAAPVIRIENRVVTGTLNLRARDCPYPLEFVGCRFERVPDLRQADVTDLRFDRCRLPGLDARLVACRGDIAIVRTTVDEGKVDLDDARIRGSLLLSESVLRGRGDAALSADRADVSGEVTATNAHVVGGIRMTNLHVGGGLHLDGAELDGGARALDGTGLRVHGSLTADHLRATETAGDALDLDGADIRGDLEAREIQVNGRVRLRGASVGGDVTFDRAIIQYRGADLLFADLLRADGLRVADSFLARQAILHGVVLLRAARIGGNLDLHDTRIETARESPRSLDLGDARIGRNLACTGSFAASRDVRLRHAEIGENADFGGADLDVLDATGARAQTFRLIFRRGSVWRVILRHARCSSLVDDEALWARVDAEDFRYESLEPARESDDGTVRMRLYRMRSGLGGYRSGPYYQLAAVLAAAGSERDARLVLAERLRHRYAVGGLPLRIWSELQRGMTGYGYRPGSLASIVLLAVAATVAAVVDVLLPEPVLGTAWFAVLPALIAVAAYVLVGTAIAHRLDDRRQLASRMLPEQRAAERALPAPPVPDTRAAIADEVRAAVRAELAGPPLVDFTGFLTVELESGLDGLGRTESGGLILDSGGEVRLAVMLTPDPSARDAAPRRGTAQERVVAVEPVHIDGGRSEEPVRFGTIVDSATLTASPRRDSLTVAHREPVRRPLSVTVPDSPGTHEAWVQLYQGGHLVQALTVQFQVRP